MNDQTLLYIINHMDWFWSHRLPLAQGAKAQGWDVRVAATGAQHDQTLKIHGFKGLNLPPIKGIIGVLRGIWSAYALIQKTKPDLVHVMTLKYAFVVGLAVRFCPGVSVIHTIAGLGYLFSSDSLRAKILRFLVGPFLKLALHQKRAQIIVQNPDDQAILIEQGFIDPARCHLIRGSGVDTDQFPLMEEAQDHDEPLVIMPTRLLHDKGISIFIAAADILKKRGVKARFQIAGGVSAGNPRTISEHEMGAMIKDRAAAWLGRVDNMPDLYARCALVLYPSWYGEGIPKALLEAASTGRAIVTTDHPGCREAVEHEKTGLLVPIKNAEATAEAVEALLKDPARRREMGQAARTKAVREFSADLIVAQSLNVYKNM